MTSILVVDDSKTDRELVRGLLTEATDFAVRTASNGREAIERIEEEPPTIVVTDLQMPEMDGLGLVRHLRESRSWLPVVLMTAYGSESIAAEALRAGAAGYVPKRVLARDLAETVERLITLRRGLDIDIATTYLIQTTYEFSLPNDGEAAAAVSGALLQRMRKLELGDETTRFQIGVALEEALANAMHHGNLEVSSALRDEEGSAYVDALNARRAKPPYGDRRVLVRIELAQDAIRILVRDEGPGFSPDDVPDPTLPENLTRAHGRGLMLIQSFMDEVAFNDVGNEIRMALAFSAHESP